MATEHNTEIKPVGVSPLLYPLDEFYVRNGRALPAVISIEGAAMPEPHRGLLVHENDMTPTLQNFHHDSLHVQALHAEDRGDFYFREVLLVLDGSGRFVEYGAIKINLGLLPADARREVLEARLPLGRILNTHHIAHASRPKAYLQLVPDDYISSVLGLAGSSVLFGRRNTLTNRDRLPLAEIVEILPPEPAA